MAILFEAQERNYPQGEDRSVSIPIPVGATRIIVTLTRVNWPSLGVPVIEAIMEVSLDGGVTWPVKAGFSTYGGQSMRNGQPVNISSVNCPLPEPENPLRVLRAVITTQTALRTALLVETE